MGAHTLRVTQGALLGSRARSRARGNTGNAEITATSVQVTGDSTIDTGTDSKTSGQAGRVAITADTLEVAGGQIRGGTSGTGNAGRTELQVGRLTSMSSERETPETSG